MLSIIITPFLIVYSQRLVYVLHLSNIILLKFFYVFIIH